MSAQDRHIEQIKLALEAGKEIYADIRRHSKPHLCNQQMYRAMNAGIKYGLFSKTGTKNSPKFHLAKATLSNILMSSFWTSEHLKLEVA